MLSADWIDNGTTQHMVASGNVGVGGLNLSRWYEFNAPIGGTPTLIQQGDINVGAGISTSYPSVAMNASDTIAMTFLENGGGQSTSMFVTGRRSSDPANMMQAPVLVKAGVLPIANELRGGDYSATEYDAANPENFWSANQFQFDNSGDNFHWGTQIAEFTIQPPPPPTIIAFATAPRLFYPFRYVFDSKTHLFSGLFTVLFSPTGVFEGPIAIVFPKLPRGVSLANANGTAAGLPAITLDGRLLPRGVPFRILIVLRNRRHVPLSTFYIGFPAVIISERVGSPM
jgi:hypothetical protein